MVTVYGADWCEDTQRSLRHLRRLGVPYRYLNVDEDPAALARAKELNYGKRRTPAIEIGPDALIEPANAALTQALIHQKAVSVEEVAHRIAVQNVGDLERAVRIATGLAASLIASRAPRPLRWPLGAAGAAAVISGIAGWCPCYAVMRRTSLGGPGDRPHEAERTGWIAAQASLNPPGPH